MARRQLPDGSWIEVMITYPEENQPSPEDKQKDEDITTKGLTGEELSPNEKARLKERRAAFEAGKEKKQAREQSKERKAIADKTREDQARRRGSQNKTVLTTPLGVTNPPTVKKKKVLGV